MKFKLIVSFIISFFMLLAGCNSKSISSQTPKPTEKPISTNSPTSTFVFTATPLPTLSSQQETSIAYEPTFITQKQTQEHFLYTAVPATLEARNAKCKSGFILELPLDVIQFSNDTWTLFTCSPLPNRQDILTGTYPDFGTRYTQIIKTDLSQTWTIQHNSFDYSTINRPDAYLSPFRWTGDGKYLYLFPRSYPGPSGFPQSVFLYTHIHSLYRINLETGEFKLFLKRDQFHALAFSPNEQFLVYSEYHNPDIIHIINMETENNLQIKLNENIIGAGAFVWAPDSTKVVFFTGYGKESEMWQDDLSGTAIFVLNPQNMNVRKVLAKDSRIFAPTWCSDNNYGDVWLNENTICIYSRNHELDIWGKSFTFNIRTGAIGFLSEQFLTLTPKP